MKKNGSLIQIILVFFLPSIAYEHGEQIIILIFSDVIFMAVAVISLIFVKFRYASKSLIFVLVIALTFLKYLFPVPQYFLLLKDSLFLNVLAVAIHIGPTIIICWIASVLLRIHKIKKGVQPKF